MHACQRSASEPPSLQLSHGLLLVLVLVHISLYHVTNLTGPYLSQRMRGGVVSGVGQINEDNRHWATLVLGWVKHLGL